MRTLALPLGHIAIISGLLLYQISFIMSIKYFTEKRSALGIPYNAYNLAIPTVSHFAQHLTTNWFSAYDDGSRAQP
ncbi:hypothetical protein [Sporomusa acidovorans]|uniref:hypothetical protein n=1 Tax=Sporomusa acidovorans TaxID=112900 RepID=UPI0011609C19|nr:hypothetical protein [Sporomusa acidovorans]